jgi:DNA primase catalytic subunit
MKIEYSFHWEKQKRYRPEITDDLIEYCVLNSDKLKDKESENVFNAIAKIPPSGRTIKVITAFWQD